MYFIYCTGTIFWDFTVISKNGMYSNTPEHLDYLIEVFWDTNKKFSRDNYNITNDSNDYTITFEDIENLIKDIENLLKLLVDLSQR